MIITPLFESEIAYLNSICNSATSKSKENLEKIRELSHRGMMTSHTTNNDPNSYKESQDSFRVKYAESSYLLVKNFERLDLKKEAISRLEQVIQFGLSTKQEVTLYKGWLSELQQLGN